MKVIFLDIDGVLNSTQYAASPRYNGKPIGYGRLVPDNYRLDPACVARLKTLVEKTGAQIVISSTWRIGGSVPRFREMFASYEWPDAPVISMTGRHPTGHRGTEVDEWLDACSDFEGEVIQFCIIDDDSDFHSYQVPFFCHTNAKVGFDDEALARALAILS